MATKRLTSKDYKRQLDELKQEQKALENRICKRCKDLITKYPNITMGVIDYVNAPAATVTTGDYLKNIERHGVKTWLELIETIEEHIASKHPHKQTTIQEFDNIK